MLESTRNKLNKRIVKLEIFNRAIIISLLIISTNTLLHGQGKYDPEYFTKLTKTLDQDTNVNYYKEVKDFFDNGKLSKHFVYVRYKKDTISYQVGNFFEFNKNGTLSCRGNIDVNLLHINDTIFKYNREGEPIFYNIYNTIDSQYLNRIDSSSICQTQDNYSRNYILSDKGFHFEKVMETPENIYIKAPNRIISIVYKNGFKNEFLEIAYNEFQYIYVPQGYYFKYNSKGEVTKKLDFTQNTANCFNFSASKKEMCIDTLNYLKITTPIIDNYIKTILKKYKGGIRAMNFAWGYVIKNKDTIPCHIVDFANHEGNYSGYKNTAYRFILSYINNSYVIYTPDEIDGYYFNNRAFISLKTDKENIFAEKLYGDSIALYELNSSLYVANLINFILDDRDNKMYYVKDYSHNEFFKNNFKFDLNNKTYSALGFTQDYEIIEYLNTLPDLDEKLKKKINNGAIPPSHLKEIFNYYYTGKAPQYYISGILGFAMIFGLYF